MGRKEQITANFVHFQAIHASVERIAEISSKSNAITHPRCVMIDKEHLVNPGVTAAAGSGRVQAHNLCNY